MRSVQRARLRRLAETTVASVLRKFPDTTIWSAYAQDSVFASLSTAAGVVQERSVNGRVDWKTKDGKTLKDLQEATGK